MIEKYQFTITYESSVNTETGEIIETKILKKSDKKSSEKKASKEVINDPYLTLEPSKLTLTNGAVTLLGAAVGDKISVRYKDKGGKESPIIGLETTFGDEDGTKLTKSLTLSFRGKKNAQLANYGDKFTLEESDIKGAFWLIGNAPSEEIDIDSELDIASLDDISVENEFDFSL